MSDKIIQMENVNKWFDDFQVLKDINLEVSLKEKIFKLDNAMPNDIKTKKIVE